MKHSRAAQPEIETPCCVIPKARAFTSGPRDLASTNAALCENRFYTRKTGSVRNHETKIGTLKTSHYEKILALHRQPQTPCFLSCGKSGTQTRISPVIARDTTCSVSLLTGTIHGSNFAIPEQQKRAVKNPVSREWDPIPAASRNRVHKPRPSPRQR
jgi:hypothetical protein